MNTRLLEETTIDACSPCQLVAAFEVQGAIILKDVFQSELVKDVHKQARRTLRNPVDALLKRPFDSTTRIGYTPPGVEGTARTGPSHLRHFLDYRSGTVKPSPLGDLLDTLNANLFEVAKKLVKNFDMGTGLKVQNIISKEEPVMRVAEYFSSEEDDDVLFPSHIDFGLLTFFVGGSSAGLELNLDGEWVPVQPEAGDVLVGTGSLLKQYYPRSKSLVHRIVASSADRISLFMFIDPSNDVILPSGELARDYFQRLLSSFRRI